MIKNVKIRILAFFMALTLSFCVCANEYYEVHALEWVAPVVGLDTALKALLGLLGISASVGLATQIDWSDLQDDCVQYQIQKGNDAVAVGRWWDKVISGGLDTASSCWASFKEWASSQLNSASGSVSTYIVKDSIPVILPSADLTNLPSDYADFSFNFADCIFTTNETYTFEFYSNALPTLNSSNNSLSIKRLDGASKVIKKSIYFTKRGSLTSYSESDFNSLVTNLNGQSVYILGYPDTLPSQYLPWDVPLDTPSGDLVGSLSDIGVIGLAPDVATDLPYDGVIDIPWENVGATDTVIDDAFDDALDKVNTGTWTLDQYWTWVQNITNVFAYDTTNNYLLPNDGDDDKADDKIQQNINRGAMVLYGLEKVFPFCIPWDIYAFVNLLVAEPVAPVIEYPIYNPISGVDEVITIDFSVWESTVVLFRYIQDFLLIIGLLLLSRSLIGAGGSD